MRHCECWFIFLYIIFKVYWVATCNLHTAICISFINPNNSHLKIMSKSLKQLQVFLNMLAQHTPRLYYGLLIHFLFKYHFDELLRIFIIEDNFDSFLNLFLFSKWWIRATLNLNNRANFMKINRFRIENIADLQPENWVNTSSKNEV